MSAVIIVGSAIYAPYTAINMGIAFSALAFSAH